MYFGQLLYYIINILLACVILCPCQATSWGAGIQGHPGHHCVTMGGCEPQAGEPLGGCQPQAGEPLGGCQPQPGDDLARTGYLLGKPDLWRDWLIHTFVYVTCILSITSLD